MRIFATRLTGVILAAWCLFISAVRGDEPRLDPAKFVTPPIEYRPIDCWWWDSGELTHERLRWQIEEMHAKGVGGTWLYPRFGANQPQSCEPGYFTDGWWEFVRFALDEHQRLDMVQYANDWLGRLDKAYFQNLLRAEGKEKPELVGRRLVAYRARSTAAETLSVTVPDGEQILTAAAYRLREASEDTVDGETYVDLSDYIDGQKITWDAPEPEWLVVAVASQPHDLDYLGPEVAKRWIEIFFAKYQERLGDRLGKSLVAYGPDERSVLNGNILYSDALRERYERQDGADFLADLAGLFIDIGPQTDRVRCQYYGAMNTLLEENLYEPFARWLHERDMKHVTIATWGRENLLGQTSNYGDFPRMMKHFDIPGNEDSAESGPMGAFIDTKISSSMAHLNGRSRVAVCAYWGMGWGYTQAENIARTNFNYALGINLYNTHGVLYSLLAGRNEFVPPEVHFYQPYWKTWRHFTDYVSRLSYVLSQGKHRSDVALVYPLSTIHAQWHAGSKFNRPADDAQKSTLSLAKELYAGSLDFNFVDEERLSKALVEPGKLKVGELEFPVAMLPAMTTLRSDVVAKLREFVAAGGTLVLFQQPPTASAEFGRDDPDLQDAWQELLGDYETSNNSIVEKSNDAGGRTILVRSSEPDAVAATRAAIRPDVTTTAKDLAHIHRQVGDEHVYYFVNRQDKPRSVDVTVRCEGTPFLWDARTGEIRPHYRYRTISDGTELRLTMAAGEGALIVMQPEKGAPQIVADNLLQIEQVAKQGGNYEIVGTADSAEKLQVTLSIDNRTFAGRKPAASVPSPVALNGLWECDYQPTMNNRWGDFKYPATDEMIGPEVPRMKYRAESASAGDSADWMASDFNDDDWQTVSVTVGPYWHLLGPFSTSADSDQLRSTILEGTKEQLAPIEVDGEILQWQPYSYSWKFGADRSDVQQIGFEGLGPVSPDFLVFDAPRRSKSIVRHLTSRVCSPRQQTLYLDFGGKGKQPSRQAWLNGEQVINTDGKESSGIQSVTLREGWNRIDLRIVQPNSRQLATFAVFHAEPETPEQPRFLPISRWYEGSKDLIYDYRPEGQKPIGWYRFQAPPGATFAKLNLNAESVEAWIDGQSVKIVDDVIQFPKSENSQAAQVALRVHHKPGFYEGAAFLAPVTFKCGRGQIPIGDWSPFGLATYSGGVKYIRHVDLTPDQLAHKVLLDLGDVRTSAEVTVNGKKLGVRLAPPYEFDLSEVAQAGDNEIEVEVLNTLANYMSATPSRYVHKGQTVSGLVGPVTLRLIPRVRIDCVPEMGAPQREGGRP